MKFPVRRLEWIEKLVSNEMISQARLDDTLDDFGYDGEIGDWCVVRKISFVQRGFLEKGSDNRLFQLRGKLTSSKTQVDYASDDGGKDTGVD